MRAGPFQEKSGRKTESKDRDRSSERVLDRLYLESCVRSSHILVKTYPAVRK